MDTHTYAKVCLHTCTPDSWEKWEERKKTELLYAKPLCLLWRYRVHALQEQVYFEISGANFTNVPLNSTELTYLMWLCLSFDSDPYSKLQGFSWEELIAGTGTARSPCIFLSLWSPMASKHFEDVSEWSSSRYPLWMFRFFCIDLHLWTWMIWL